AVGNGRKAGFHHTSFSGGKPGSCPGGVFRSMITATGKGMHTLNKPAMKRQSSMGINARLLLMTLLATGLMALVMGGYFSWQQLRYTEEQLPKRDLMSIEYMQQPPNADLLSAHTGPIGSFL